MILLRNEQMTLFRRVFLREHFIKVVIRQLMELGYICGDGNEQCIAQIDPELKMQLLHDLFVADEHGVRSEDGYIQFAGYRFEFGDDWQQWDKATTVLSEKCSDEENFLSSIYKTLTSVD
ncbi:MAG TPA: hypothetical protein VHO70_23645 [Chitinispirillaceae bacterium]|nr:hypothetical protein [Chitinispirillaceae bacterium]